MTTTRQEKVNSLLKREISAFLLAEGFEEITGLLTITGVEVTPDLQRAKVFFSVVGQEEEEVGEILKKHIYQIQGMLNQKLKMYRIPRITFVLDRSGAYAQHIGKIIQRLHKEDDPPRSQ